MLAGNVPQVWFDFYGLITLNFNNMEYKKLIKEHKDILEFRERPYNKRAYIEEFLKLAEKKVKNLTIPVVMASSASSIEWISSIVKCDLCGFEWVAVYHKDCDKLECNGCGNMVDFENLP